MPFVGGPNTRITNPRWWTAAILEKIQKSPHLGRGLTDFDQIWHGDTSRPSWAVILLKLWNFKNPRSWELEKLPYLCCGLTDLEKIWQGVAVRPFWAFRPLKFQKFKNPRWQWQPSWKIEKSPYLRRGLSDFDEIWHGESVWPSLPFQSLKFLNFKNLIWWWLPFWNFKNRHICATIWPIVTKFGTVTHVDPLESWPCWPSKLWNCENPGARFTHDLRTNLRHILR